jgi:phosphopantothenate synthetase
VDLPALRPEKSVFRPVVNWGAAMTIEISAILKAVAGILNLFKRGKSADQLIADKSAELRAEEALEVEKRKLELQAATLEYRKAENEAPGIVARWVVQATKEKPGDLWPGRYADAYANVSIQGSNPNSRGSRCCPARHRESLLGGRIHLRDCTKP